MEENNWSLVLLGNFTTIERSYALFETKAHCSLECSGHFAYKCENRHTSGNYDKSEHVRAFKILFFDSSRKFNSILIQVDIKAILHCAFLLLLLLILTGGIFSEDYLHAFFTHIIKSVWYFYYLPKMIFYLKFCKKEKENDMFE